MSRHVFFAIITSTVCIVASMNTLYAFMIHFFNFFILYSGRTEKDRSFWLPLAQAGAMCADAPIAFPSPSFTTVRKNPPLQA